MLDLIQKPKHYSNNIKQHTESFLEVVVVEDTCCCKVSSVIVNSWQKALSSLFAEEDSMKIDLGVPPPGCFDFT